jgi:hypothetical protein
MEGIGTCSRVVVGGAGAVGERFGWLFGERKTLFGYTKVIYIEGLGRLRSKKNLL